MVCVSDEKIATRAYLLGKNPETIERNYQLLVLSYKIASQAYLLAMNPETIERNYRNHVGLLRQDYTDRTSGRDLLLSQAQLLGIPPETIVSNIQYLHSMGIDYHKGDLLGTKPKTKRMKLAWMLRELFNYREVSQKQKKEVIQRLYDFVRNDPSLFVKSISSLERNKEKLKEKVQNYKEFTNNKSVM